MRFLNLVDTQYWLVLYIAFIKGCRKTGVTDRLVLFKYGIFLTLLLHWVK